MHKIDGAGHIDGEFVGEDLETNRPPTEVTPKWLNAVQRELLAIGAAGGFTPDDADNAHAAKTIKRLAGGHVRTVTAADPTVLTADDTGLVIVDATANNVAITMPAVNAVTGAPLKFKFVRLDATANTVTVTRAGADTFMGGATSFALTGEGDYRTVEGDAVSAWIFTAAAANTNATGFKTPVRFTTTGNVALAGLGTQAGGDWGGALTAGDRILPKDQTTGSQNGIYIAAAGAWARATDADGVGELVPGALVTVQEGATLADSVWELSTDGPITIGTTALTFSRKDSVPVLGQQPGEICYFARNTAPTGSIKANGAAISRTTYSALFAAIGTTFGVGDGSTTFNVPDLRGEFVRGWDDSRGIDTGRAFGSAQADDFKSHTHTFASPQIGGGTVNAAAPTGGGSQATGATGGTETRPRNVAMLACIKY